METREACACLATFASPSEHTKKAVASTSAGRRPTGRRQRPGRMTRCKTVERRPETVRQFAGRAEPVRELGELANDGPRVLEQRLPVRSQRYRRRQRLAHASEPAHGSILELAADSLAFRFCRGDEALAGRLEVGDLTPGRIMETGIVQRKLGGGRNAIGQGWIDGPSLVSHEDADFEPGQS